MDNELIAKQLKTKEVTPTVIRLLVASALASCHEGLSMSDIERRLQTVDKSSIFRALTTFQQHHLVHEIDDGTNQLKYAWCGEGCMCGEDSHAGIKDEHMHFHCERCGRTFCMSGIAVPEVALPEGYHVHSANMVLKGLCPDCIGRYGCKK